MCDVCRYYRNFINCLYALTARHCSQRGANFVFSFITIGQIPYIEYHNDCDLGDVGKLLLTLLAINIRHNVNKVMLVKRL